MRLGEFPFFPLHACYSEVSLIEKHWRSVNTQVAVALGDYDFDTLTHSLRIEIM